MRGLYWVFLAAPLLIVGILSARGGFSGDPLPLYGKVGSFHLVDQKGVERTEKDFGGKVWVASFVFSHCPMQCPIIIERLKTLHGVHQVSFSLDPENDTPEVLTELSKRHGLSENWTFLTGSIAEIQKLLDESFRLSAKVGKVDQDSSHTTHSVLIDKEGQVRGYYDSVDPHRLEELSRDISRL